MSGRYPLAVALLSITACARSAPPALPAPVEPPVVEADTAERRTRHAVRPVPWTNAFRDAVARDTRTPEGVPGPNYWQQRVDYRIDAELDPAAARVAGAATITYHNNSPDTLTELRFLLYQNAYAEGVQRVRRVPITGGMTLESVMVEGRRARAVDQLAGPLTYNIDGTQMRLRLGRPLPPGGRTSVDVGWNFVVPPRGAPRTGHIDNEVFVVAQWYPQVATYDDVHGWHALPYWTNGEFYLEYGNFDVSLTVPERWLVDATGMLQNPEEVLTLHAREQLERALSQDSIVQVVTEQDGPAGTRTEMAPGGQLTWRFSASGVRDFAFATSAEYVWDATRAVLRDGEGGTTSVLVNALYRPQHAAWREAARYTRHAVTFHAERWHPYIYPKISSVEGPVGGMEYPMIVFIGSPTDPVALYAVISHEVAHEWWPMMVGSNESRYAWQDEGLVTYVEDLSVRDYFPDERPELTTQQSYLRIAGADGEREIMREPDLFGIGPQYGVAAYTKPGTLLRALGGVIGEDVVHDALRAYTARWLFLHPTPWDFFNTVEAVAGEDLDWFWHPWFFETAALDQAVGGVRQSADSAWITIDDRGDAPMPAHVTITLADGTTLERTIDVESWLDGYVARTLPVATPSPVTRVEIDRDQRFPDVDRSNNVWTSTPGGGP